MYRAHARHALVALFALPVLATSDLPPQLLPVLGGTGGSSFNRDCGAGRVLTGVRYRSALVIDAIGLQCRPVLSDGSLGPESTVGTLAGGGGGTTAFLSCSSGRVATGLFVKYGSYVSYVHLHCRPWHAATRTYGTASSDLSVLSFGSVGTPGTEIAEDCESAHQPGSGLRGRAASFVDAIGLVCDEP